MDYQEFVNKLIEKYGEDRSKLIEMAFDIQEQYNYIPKELLKILCDRLKIFYAEAYSSISFFKDFRFQPKEKIKITVCNGTSCYFNGGKELYEELIQNLGEDYEIGFSYCYKCCAKYPVVVIEKETLLNANYQKIKEKIRSYNKN